jgi:hypothetical protein
MNYLGFYISEKNEDPSQDNQAVKENEQAQFVQPIATAQARKPNLPELLDILDEMWDRIEKLPPEALYAAVTHCDFAQLLKLLAVILRAI